LRTKIVHLLGLKSTKPYRIPKIKKTEEGDLLTIYKERNPELG